MQSNNSVLILHPSFAPDASVSLISCLTPVLGLGITILSLYSRQFTPPTGKAFLLTLVFLFLEILQGKPLFLFAKVRNTEKSGSFTVC